MGTYTPNLNLYKPDANDDFGSFRTEFNDNMDKLDNGGGGGGGGHTIVDENGSDMPAESKLQFTGNVSVTDDNVNGATVVDILGGGGNVYGAFLDPSRVIYSAFTFDNTEHSWTATDDVILTDDILPPSGSMAWYVRIDGKQVGAGYDLGNLFVYVKKGQVVTYRAKSGSTMKAYGLLQGTNGIFAPVIYSDTERKIGVWRNNKPLYAKTVHINALPDSAHIGQYVDYPHGISDIDEIIDYEGIIHFSNGTTLKFVRLGFNVNSFTPSASIDSYCNPTDIRIMCGSDRSSANADYTILYTKTTDVAGSGDYNTYGVPTVHYSTSEQVVGTWLDGRPIYQKTVPVTSNIPYNTWQNTGVLVDASADNVIAVPQARAQTGSSNMLLLAYFDNGVLVVMNMRNVNYGNNFPYYITVQYTKSTDL